MSDKIETELTIGPKAIQAYSRLSYTMWFALAEFVDNSTQSRLNYDSIIDKVLEQEGQPLTVNIVHDRQDRSIIITDNSIGMTRDDLVAALKIAEPTPDSKGRSKYGMGLKTAACWIGADWTVSTCEWGSGEEWTAWVDVNEIANRGAKVPLTQLAVDKDLHYTKITIRKLRRVIQARSEDTIKTYLGSMYMFDLRPDQQGRVALKLTYNGEEILPPTESDWDTDPSGNLMKRELPALNLGDKTVTGWIGVLRKGGRKFGGFSIFQNKRQIQGFPSAWKPKSIFGGVDDEGGNNLIAQRLTGVLLLDGFAVSHTKDQVLFEDDDEEKLEQFLVKETKAYADYAQKRRSTEKGRKWSREAVREMTAGLQEEFSTNEMKDALANAMLPPEEAITASNQQLLKSLKAEDELFRINLANDLIVIVSLKEQSEWEPYVAYVAGAGRGEVHVIINGLHPYYQTLEVKDAIHECIQQFMFDAVAESKVALMSARLNPNSIRYLKNNLLVTRSQQLQNADAEVRAKAEAELFGNTSESR